MDERSGAVEQDGWSGFMELCGSAHRAEQLHEMFELFLTHEEKRDLSLRFMLIQALLEEKKTQREISSMLNVSISRITRGSNALKIVNDRLREFLKNHFKRETC